ncbi:MAG: 50S ribosomal protein L25 [Actinomycetes bacterium]
MSEITLTAEVGRTLGSSATRRLRREGKIPGVVYGHGADPIAVAVEGKAIRTALNGEAGTNQLLELDTGTERLLVLAKVLQRHPVRGTLTHVDFQITGRDETVTVEVVVNLLGESLEVRHADGAIDQQLFTISVNARPGSIPTSLDLDISAMVPGDVLRVADLALPDGVTAQTDAEAAIAIAHAARTSGSIGDEEVVTEEVESAESSES